MKILLCEKNWQATVYEPENPKIGISAAILRNLLEEKFVQGSYYKLTAELDVKESQNTTAPYVMITQLNADKKNIIRTYAENENGNPDKKVYVFKIEEGCEFIRIDIGLRGKGSVVFKALSIEETEAPAPRKVKIAATKLNGSKTKQEAMDKIKAAADKAGREGADLIIFGEIINDYGCGLSLQDSAETLEGEYCTTMKEYAKKYNAYIVINFHLKDEEGRIYNASALIDRKGEIAGVYKKTHISFNEFEIGVTAGEEYPVFDTDFGKLGILICWDAYFPEAPRIIAENGAEIIAISTAGNPAHRHIARARENGVYVAVSGNGVTKDEDEKLYPSKIIDPCGNVLSAVNEEGEVAIAEVDLNELKKIHWLSVAASDALPNNIYMNEKRPELYGRITE